VKYSVIKFHCQGNKDWPETSFKVIIKIGRPPKNICYKNLKTIFYQNGVLADFVFTDKENIFVTLFVICPLNSPGDTENT